MKRKLYFKKFSFLLLLLLVAIRVSAQPANGVSTFDNGAGGNLYSYGALPASGTLDGWTFTLSGVGSGSIYHNRSSGRSMINMFSNATTTISIKSDDGSEFALDDFDAQWFNFSGSYTITAYKDGVSQGTASGTASSTMNTTSVASNTAFDDIDEFVFSGFGGSNVTLNLDEITISAAVSGAVTGTFDFETVSGSGTPVLTQTVNGITATATSDLGSDVETQVGISGDGIGSNTEYTYDWRLRFNKPVDISGIQLLEFVNQTSGSQYQLIPNNGTPISIADNNAALSDFYEDYSPADWTDVSQIIVRYNRAFSRGSNHMVGIDNIQFTASSAANGWPYATNVTISGPMVVGELLQGSYSYNDPDSDPESGSTYQWYRSDDFAGTNKAAISGATGQSYTPVAGDVGKYLSFAVTVNDGTNASYAEESMIFGPVFATTSISSIFSFDQGEGLIRSADRFYQQDASGIRLTATTSSAITSQKPGLDDGFEVVGGVPVFTGYMVRASLPNDETMTLTFSDPVTVTSFNFGEFYDDNDGYFYEWTAFNGATQVGTKISLANNGPELGPDNYEVITPTDWIGITSIELSYTKPVVPQSYIAVFDQLEFEATVGAPPNTAPTASSVNFSGTLTVGATLTGSYTYSDVDSDPESGTTFQWYRSDDASGTNKLAISGATASTYALVAADSGKFISFEVTPNDGTAAGSAVESALQGAVSRLSVSITAQTNVDCNGAATGALTATVAYGTPNYSYSWSNGNTTSNTSSTTNTITSLVAGKYTVTVTDINGITDTVSATITQPTALIASAFVDSNVSCNAAMDGGATASATGGTALYTYAWSNGATTASITGVAAGIYTVTITDNNLCTDTSSITITEPAALMANVAVDSNVSCGSNADGGLTATPTGGTGPYSYMWSNGATTPSISGVGMGTYSVTITDNNGCTAIDSATVGSNDVTPPTAMAFNITSYFNNGPGIATLSGYNLFTFGPTKVSLPFNDPIPLGAEIERVEIIMNVNYPMGTGTATNEVYIGGTLIGTATVGGSSGNKSYTLTYDTVPPGFVYGGSNTFELISTVNPVYFKSTSIRLYYKQPNCEAYAFVPPLIAFDNCAVATITNDYNGTSDAADIYPIGVTMVNWTVTDSSGNTTNTSQTVTVIDNEEPEAYARDLTVYLDATGSATITAAQVDSGSTDVCGIDTITLSKYTFSCVDTGDNNITLTALDPHGNSEDAPAVITVIDTLGPTAVAQNITVYLDTNGLVSITAADLDNGSNDNCGIDTLILSQYDFSCAEAGVNSVRFKAYDANGFVDSTVVNVTVVDTLKPLPVTRNLTVYLDASGNGAITATMADSATTDNCAIDTLILSQYAFDCSHVGNNTLDFVAIDPSGNSDTTTFDVMVMDTIKPAMAVQNINVYLDAMGMATVTAADVDNGTADACGIDTLILSQYNFDCSHVGANTINFTATDNNGNTDSATATLTVIDTVSPALMVQNLTVYLDGAGTASIMAADADNGTTDACGIDTLILSQYNFDCSHVGTNTISFTANDVNGNTATTTFTVTVMDTLNPAAVAQNLTVYLDATGMANITAMDADNGSADNCAIDTLILSQYNFDCSHVGNNTLNFVAIDPSGNSDTTILDVMVMDTIKPAMAVQNINVYLDAIGMATVTAADVDNGTADACGIDTLILSQYNFDCSHVGANTINFTATDNNGNTDSATATLTVIDTISPALSVQNLTVYLDGAGMASITAADADNGTTDACGIDTLILSQYNFDCSHVGANTISFTANDVNGNTATTTFTVTVMDTLHPTAVAQNLTVYLDATGMASITAMDADNGSSDNCAIDTLILSQYAFDCSHVGNNTITFTANDVNGNSDTTTFDVMVMDTVSPALHIQDITVYLDAMGAASITAAMADSATAEACGIDTLILSQYDFDCSHVGTNTISFTANDVNGNSAATTFTVTVMDTTPTVVAAQNLTIYLDAAGMASITAVDADNGSGDACGIDTLMLSQYDFDCSHVGVNTTTFTAVDNNGNSISTTFDVTVMDTIHPSAVAQNLTVYLDGTGMASITAADADNGSADNCAMDTLILSQYNFDCSHTGSNTVTFTANDVNGNTDTTTFEVMVMDTIEPAVVAQNLTVYLDAMGMAGITASDVDNGSSDVCGLDTLMLSQYAFDCSHVGANTISLKVYDNNGNVDSAAAIITVMDTVSPTVMVQNLTISLTGAGSVSITAADLDNGTADACGIDTIVLSQYNFVCADAGSNAVSFTATDVNGNSAMAMATVTIIDTTKPIITAHDTTVYLDAMGMASIALGDVYDASTAGCGVDTVYLDTYSFGCAELGPNTVNITAISAGGATAVLPVTVTVVDTILPKAKTKNITVYLDQNGAASITPADVDNGSADNCGYALSLSQSSFSCSETGLNLIKFWITDADNNQDSSEVLITVKDTISPELHLINKLTVTLDQFGRATIAANQLDSASTDNCANMLFFTASQTQFTCADLGSNVINVTVYDNKNNSATGTATVEVIDLMAPVVSTSNSTIYLTASGFTLLTPAMIDNGSADNCGIDTMWLDTYFLTCADIGQNTVQLYAADANGNKAQSNAVITIVDTMGPVVNTKNHTLYLDATGSATLTVADVDNGSFDYCWLQSMTLSQTAFGCADVGAQMVTLTGADTLGNTTSATATVTVVDTIKPVVATKNISVTLDATGSATITTSDIDNGSMDACGIQTMVASQTTFGCADIGTNTITLSVTDNNGNIDSATATVTVIDAQAPVVATQNITIYLDANGDATITPADVDNGSTDNCGIDTSSLDISVFDCADLGQNLVIFTATDASNNSASKSAYVTVLDTMKPVLSALPASITAYTQPGQCVANVQWPAITATDNCVVTTISTSSANGSLFPKGTTTVQVTATDGSANTVTQSFNVIVQDTISPVVSNVPVNFTVVANPATCDAQVNWIEPIATDNCGGVTWTKSHLPGAVFPVGTTTVTYTATDADNNSTTVSFAVVVSDNVAPVITNVPANMTVSADKGSCDAVVNFTAPTVTDNCTNPVLTASHTSGSVFPAGVTTVTFTATDAGNNVTTASFTITVEDNEKPVVSSMPANDTIGICSASYTYAKPVATDNCSGVTVTQISGLASGSLFPAGVTVNSFRISDANGNDTTVSFAVVVVPQGLPSLPGVLEICEESPAIDLALGQNIVWTGQGIVNSTSFDPAMAGAGRHKLDYAFTDKMGCTTNGTIYITVLPQPVKPVVNRVGSHTLSTGNYSTYQWYRDGILIPDATSQNYQYTLGGNYQVVVGNTSGCNNHSDGFVVGQSGGGIGLEENTLGSLELYPNPTNGVIMIDLNQQHEQDIEVVVFSIAGKKVLERKDITSAQGKLSLDLSHLPDATYMVRILSGSESVIKRVVVY